MMGMRLPAGDLDGRLDAILGRVGAHVVGASKLVQLPGQR